MNRRPPSPLDKIKTPYRYNVLDDFAEAMRQTWRSTERRYCAITRRQHQFVLAMLQHYKARYWDIAEEAAFLLEFTDNAAEARQLADEIKRQCQCGRFPENRFGPAHFLVMTARRLENLGENAVDCWRLAAESLAADPEQSCPTSEQIQIYWKENGGACPHKLPDGTHVCVWCGVMVKQG
jgi:hypothetical protein